MGVSGVSGAIGEIVVGVASSIKSMVADGLVIHVPSIKVTC